jgi:inorganic pyrophosphatase
VNLATIPHKLDPKTKTCRAVIETPKGSRSKYDYCPKQKAFRLKTLLPDGMSFPLDFGFVPSTLAGDGDPLDVMVLMDEPLQMGVFLDVRLIGAVEAEEHEHGEKERNDRLIAAATVSRLYEKMAAPADLGDPFIDNLIQFWTNKARLEGKSFHCLNIVGPDAAVQLVQTSAAAAKKA